MIRPIFGTGTLALTPLSSHCRQAGKVSSTIALDDLPRYKEDIENARKLGCNSFRLSLGQSKYPWVVALEWCLSVFRVYLGLLNISYLFRMGKARTSSRMY